MMLSRLTHSGQRSLASRAASTIGLQRCRLELRNLIVKLPNSRSFATRSARVSRGRMRALAQQQADDEIAKVSFENELTQLMRKIRAATTAHLSVAPVEAAFAELKRDAPPSVWVALLTMFSRRGELRKMAQYFEEMRKPAPSNAYLTMLEGYAAASDTASMLSLLARMQTDKVHPNIAIFTTVMRALQASGEQPQLMDCFEELKKARIPPSQATFIMVLRAASEIGALERLVGYIQEMEALRIPFNAEVYEAIVDAFTQSQGLEPEQPAISDTKAEAQIPASSDVAAGTDTSIAAADPSVAQLVERMRELKFAATPRLFEALLHRHARTAIARAKPLTEADAPALSVVGETLLTRVRSTLAAMRAQSLKPDAACFRVALMAFALLKGYHSERMALLQEEMKQDGVAATVETETARAIVLAKQGGSESVVELMTFIDDMQARALQPNVVFYNEVLQALVRHDKSKPAQPHQQPQQQDSDAIAQVLDRMRRDGLTPNIHSYNCILEALARKGDFAAILSRMQQMTRESAVQPTAASYALLIQALDRAGQFDSCVGVLSVMDKAMVAPDAAVLHALLEACARHDRMDEAERLWRRLLERHELQPDVPLYTAYMHGLLRCKQVYKAVTLFRTMRDKHALVPTLRMCLVFASHFATPPQPQPGKKDKGGSKEKEHKAEAEEAEQEQVSAELRAAARKMKARFEWLQGPGEHAHQHRTLPVPERPAMNRLIERVAFEFPPPAAALPDLSAGLTRETMQKYDLHLPKSAAPKPASAANASSDPSFSVEQEREKLAQVFEVHVTAHQLESMRMRAMMQSKEKDAKSTAPAAAATAETETKTESKREQLSREKLNALARLAMSNRPPAEPKIPSFNLDLSKPTDSAADASESAATPPAEEPKKRKQQGPKPRVFDPRLVAELDRGNREAVERHKARAKAEKQGDGSSSSVEKPEDRDWSSFKWGRVKSTDKRKSKPSEERESSSAAVKPKHSDRMWGRRNVQRNVILRQLQEQKKLQSAGKDVDDDDSQSDEPAPRKPQRNRGKRARAQNSSESASA